jgi:hypothetical protein
MALSTIDQTGLSQSRILTPVNQPAGAVLQMQSAYITNGVTTSGGSSGANWYDLGLSVTITPTSANSKFLLRFDSTYTNANLASSGAYGGYFSFVRNGTRIYQTTSTGSGPAMSGGTWMNLYSQYMNVIGGTGIDTPNTTSSITYKIQVSSEGAGNAYWGVSGNTSGYTPSSVSTFTVMEIAG